MAIQHHQTFSRTGVSSNIIKMSCGYRYIIVTRSLYSRCNTLLYRGDVIKLLVDYRYNIITLSTLLTRTVQEQVYG